MPIFEILLFGLIPLCSIVGGIFYTKYPKIKQDNVIEESIEKIIKEKTGIDVDLSPDTPEDSDGNK